MYKAFCDTCGTPVDKPQQFHFPSLLHTGNDRYYGMDITLTCGGQPSTSLHICDECFPKMLLAAAPSLSEPKVVRFTPREIVDMREALTKREEVVGRREEILEAQIKGYILKLDDLRKKAVLDDEQIKLLEAQVSKFKNEVEQLTRRADAAKAQKQIDLKDNPDYLHSVARRERVRLEASAK